MDSMPDDWEESLGLNPDNPDDAWEDTDGDGMVNLHEYFAATDPGDADRLSIESIQSSGGGQSVILTFNLPGLTYAAEHATSMAPDWVEVDCTRCQPNPSTHGPCLHKDSPAVATAYGSLPNKETQGGARARCSSGPFRESGHRAGRCLGKL